METKSVNFFSIPVLSFNPKSYKQLVKEKAGKIFAALLLCFIVGSIISAVVTVKEFTSAMTLVKNELPYFCLSDGELSCEQKIELDEEGYYLLLDDSVSDYSISDLQKFMSSRQGYTEMAMVIGSDGITVYNRSNGFNQITYSQLEQAFSPNGNQHLFIDKDILIDKFVPLVNSFIYIFTIIGAIFVIGAHYLVCLLLQFVVNIAETIFDITVDKVERYRLTVLAKFAVAVLLWAVGLFVAVPHSFMISILLSAAYIFVIVYFLKNNKEFDGNDDYTENTDIFPQNNDIYTN